MRMGFDKLAIRFGIVEFCDIGGIIGNRYVMGFEWCLLQDFAKQRSRVNLLKIIKFRATAIKN